MSLHVLKNVVTRSLALFISFALPSVGVGAFAGVVTDLAREFLKDGDLTLAEVDEVFKKASKGKGGK